MARGLGIVTRGWLRWVLVILGVILAGFLTQSIVGDTTVVPRLASSRPVATIGSGSSAIPVAEDGKVLDWLQLPEDVTLPELPLEAPPQGPRLRGPALEQVRVLAAVPADLQPYVVASHFGESGVDVELSTGIEVRFGNASGAARKWRVAAAVLASPEVTTLDYVDVQAPRHPSTGGSGHLLPTAP